MGLGVEPGSPGTALNAPPGLHYILHLVGGKWRRGQMGTEGKLFEFIMFSLCFVTIQKFIILYLALDDSAAALHSALGRRIGQIGPAGAKTF